MFTLSWLKKDGFEGYETVGCLSDTNSRKIIPLESGVYIFFREADNDSIEILYIGKAIRLRRRLSQYIRQSKNHRGGYRIWTLDNYADFVVCWKCCDNPREYETKLIKCHRDLFGNLPFANRMV
jgi:excinuclease UvrABC nuclease subunit